MAAATPTAAPNKAPNTPIITPNNVPPTANHIGKVMISMIAITTVDEDALLRVAMG